MIFGFKYQIRRGRGGDVGNVERVEVRAGWDTSFSVTRRRHSDG